MVPRSKKSKVTFGVKQPNCTGSSDTMSQPNTRRLIVPTVTMSQPNTRRLIVPTVPPDPPIPTSSPKKRTREESDEQSYSEIIVKPEKKPKCFQDWKKEYISKLSRYWDVFNDKKEFLEIEKPDQLDSEEPETFNTLLKAIEISEKEESKKVWIRSKFKYAYIENRLSIDRENIDFIREIEKEGKKEIQMLTERLVRNTRRCTEFNKRLIKFNKLVQKDPMYERIYRDLCAMYNYITKERKYIIERIKCVKYGLRNF
jgi:hypothetical protein